MYLRHTFNNELNSGLNYVFWGVVQMSLSFVSSFLATLWVLSKLILGVLSTSTAVIDAMRWHGDCDTVFHVINRSTGEATKVVYTSESFFFLHTINAYEEGGYIVIDIAMYQNPHMLHCMSLTALQTAQSDPSYAQRFRGKPHRFVLPLSPNMRSRSNLVNLPYTSARAHVDRHGHIRLTPQQLCHVGCETPTINYNR